MCYYSSMYVLPPDQSRELLEATDRFCVLRFNFVAQKLGIAAVLRAADEQELLTRKAPSLSYEDWERYCLDTEEQDSAAAVHTEGPVVFRMYEAEHEFDRRVEGLIGEVNGYRFGYAQRSSLVLDRGSIPGPEGLIRLRAQAADVDTASVIKKRFAVTGRRGPEELAVTELDMQTIGEAIPRLKAVNSLLSN